MKIFKLSPLLFLILLTPLIYAELDEEVIFKSSSIELDIDLNASFTIKKISDPFLIDYIKAHLSYIPKNDSYQEIISIKTTPKAIFKNNSYVFEWIKPELKKYKFNLNSRVKIYNFPREINKEIPFPIEIIPEEINEYLKATNIIDSENEKIIKQASKLVEGETDLFKAVYKLGVWTKENVNYNLSTQNIDASQKSSWVLENKEGVCDEITNLFIGLCRALGVPAKFVSGISYTNSELFNERWGPHGWAEVYFPDFGWVPFDITYGQYGYVDASHIKFRSGLDSNSSSINYEWLSTNAKIDTNPLSFNVEIISFEGEIFDEYEIRVFALKDKVGFGSYNLIQADLYNPTEKYIPAQIYISNTEGLELLDPFSQGVLLKPQSKSSITWRLKVNDNLNQNYIYTFPFKINSKKNLKEDSFFKSENNAKTYTLNDIESYLSSITKEEKVYSKEIEINCSDVNYYIYESKYINCDIKNKGNIYHQDLNACLGFDCEEFDLGIGKSIKIEFPLNLETIGINEKNIYVKNKEVSKNEEVLINILDVPSITIKEIVYPKNVTYHENISISFEINQISNSIPKETTIIISNRNYEKIWDEKNFSGTKNYIINLNTKDLKKENIFNIEIHFKDLNGRKYSVNEEITIFMDKLTVIQKFKILMKDFLKLIEKNIIISTIIIGLIFFFIILKIILSGTNLNNANLKKYKNKIKTEDDKTFLKELKKEEKEDEKYFN